MPHPHKEGARIIGYYFRDNWPTVKFMNDMWKSFTSPQTTYTDGYRAGLEAAAIECENVDERTCASLIRALPVPEKQAVNVEEVIKSLGKIEEILDDMKAAMAVADYTKGKVTWAYVNANRRNLVHYVEAALAAAGVKVEG